MANLDLEERDPNQINDHIKVQFADVLAEPDGTHSCECVWSISNCCFDCGKNCWYKLLTALCGCCLAFYWGCCFAQMSFDHVWCYTPGYRIFAICMTCYQKVFGTVVNCFLAPICDTCGLFFSNIAVRMDKSG